MLTSHFKEFAGLLRSNRVEYLIVGGYALAAYGHPRYTGDLDFWIGRSPDNADRVLRCSSMDDFKTNKKATGRHKDLADLELLESPRRDGIGS
jgi:hypothetical protein